MVYHALPEEAEEGNWIPISLLLLGALLCDYKDL